MTADVLVQNNRISVLNANQPTRGRRLPGFPVAANQVPVTRNKFRVDDR